MKKNMLLKNISCGILTILMGATLTQKAQSASPTFGSDIDFLKKYVQVITLSDSEGKSKVAVVPAWQGRIMTSTAKGDKGLSYGWVNRELIASRKFEPHINVFGGEDRFWLGPEGGQYSIFFSKGAKFDLEHWFTPAAIDTEPYDVVRFNSSSVLCRKQFSLTNYSGATFNLEVQREVRVSNPELLLRKFGVEPFKNMVATSFESINTVKNTGQNPWTKDTGLLSIWILGMFNASEKATVVIPLADSAKQDPWKAINDRYFGKVPPERLVIKNNVVYFKADAKYRSKIGIKPQFCKPVLGSYDSENKVLTIVHFTLPEGATDYVNSMWELQDKPYEGDAVNSYNDGPSSPGAKQLGKFYELESSSPALALKPGETATHVHQTVHIQGTEKQLDVIARAILGAGLEDIKNAFKKK
ncbi:MAG: hypothetical protein N2487_02560 [Verrucomicrobiae bacterium]|nr:hypothetical protein [Verrucomicrobiae bacterium]